MLFSIPYYAQISRILLNEISLIKEKYLSLIFSVLNSYLFMIILSTMVKLMRMRRNQNLIKCFCWPSQYYFQVILGKEKEEKANLIIDQNSQEAILLALNAISIIKRAIRHLNTPLTSWTTKVTKEKLTNLVVL